MHHVDCFHLSQCAAWHLRRDLFFYTAIRRVKHDETFASMDQTRPPGNLIFPKSKKLSNYADCGLCKLLMFRVVQVALVRRA